MYRDLLSPHRSLVLASSRNILLLTCCRTHQASAGLLLVHGNSIEFNANTHWLVRGRAPPLTIKLRETTTVKVMYVTDDGRSSAIRSETYTA